VEYLVMLCNVFLIATWSPFLTPPWSRPPRSMLQLSPCFTKKNQQPVLQPLQPKDLSCQA